MSEFTVHQETIAPTMDAEGNVDEVIGEIDIPADAMGVNTTALAASPPIVTVTWVEPVVQ